MCWAIPAIQGNPLCWSHSRSQQTFFTLLPKQPQLTYPRPGFCVWASSSTFPSTVEKWRGASSLDTNLEIPCPACQQNSKSHRKEQARKERHARPLCWEGRLSTLGKLQGHLRHRTWVLTSEGWENWRITRLILWSLVEGWWYSIGYSWCQPRDADADIWKSADKCCGEGCERMQQRTHKAAREQQFTKDHRLS